ncbi:MAG TPA: Mov34/MPN/PAD-1 family protein [Acidobacteriota bacterium]|nr:Mov34/MPN/PAD-1 family protein [Acidobacteriota bacterium]
MNKEVKRRIEDHARSSPDREVCGFVYPERYVPLRNQSADPRRFEADPRDIAAALARYGEPLAIFHSHPGGPAQPSVSDLREYYHISSSIQIGCPAEDGRMELAFTEIERNIPTFSP